MKFVVTRVRTSDLASLEFSLLICKAGIINCPALLRVVRRTKRKIERDPKV